MIRSRIERPRRWALALTWLLLLCASSVTLAAEVVDRLGVPGPIRLGDNTYALQWSANQGAMYKQEYVPAGQSVDRYESMVLLDVQMQAAGVSESVTAMVAQLDARKATDPLVHYDIIMNQESGEAVLDFILSARDSQGVIVEWNAYRYTPGPNGQGVTILALSRRGYGDEGARAFLMGLKNERQANINTLAAYPMPRITPATR